MFTFSWHLEVDNEKGNCSTHFSLRGCGLGNVNRRP